MKSLLTSIGKHAFDLKKELNSPKLNGVRREYLIETIKMLDEYLVNKIK